MKVKKWTMKKTILLLVPVLIIGMFTCAQAAITADPFNQGVLDEVSFWVIDDPVNSNDFYVTLVGGAFSLPTGYWLQYLYSGVSGWMDFAGSATFATGSDHYELVYFQIINNAVTPDIDKSGNPTFWGNETPTPSWDGPTPWYNTITIDWNEGSAVELYMATASGNDNIAPIPITTSALLLGSGILGLIAIGRVKRRDS